MNPFLLKLSAAIALLFCCTNVSAYDFEVDGMYFEKIGIDSVSVTLGAEKYTGSVVIPSAVKHDGVEYSVTSIGSYAFFGCSDLVDVVIPKSVTILGFGAFEFCSNLENVRFADGSDNLNIHTKDLYFSGYSPFYKCDKITTLYLGRTIDFINDISVGSSFGSSLKNVTISQSVKAINDRLFYGCTGLTSITIPNSVTSIGDLAFNGCTNLTSASIGDSVTSIGRSGYSIFSGCTSLAKVVIGDGLEYIDNNLFSDCEALEEISFGMGLKQIFTNAFSNCTFLSKITCHSTTPPTASLLTFYRYTYDNVDVYVPRESLNEYKNDNVWKKFLNLHGADLTGINNVTADDTVNGEQRIYDLQGRKLKKPIRGLNIINGKKVVVK